MDSLAIMKDRPTTDMQDEDSVTVVIGLDGCASGLFVEPNVGSGSTTRSTVSARVYALILLCFHHHQHKMKSEASMMTTPQTTPVTSPGFILTETADGLTL